MAREVIEYRAVGVDHGRDRDYRTESEWTTFELARSAARHMRTAYEPDLAYDEVFIERRRTVYGEPERVKEGDDHA